MKTVRARICVAINSNGRWAASGWSDLDDNNAIRKAKEFLYLDSENMISSVRSVHFIEADVPIPDPHKAAIQGKVKP